MLLCDEGFWNNSMVTAPVFHLNGVEFAFKINSNAVTLLVRVLICSKKSLKQEEGFTLVFDRKHLCPLCSCAAECKPVSLPFDPNC